MDIKLPSDLPPAKPVVSQTGDLLAQLRAAGTIEAEVLKLLPGNKLLLASRLGDILTSNSLNYQAGDRLNLRFDDSAQQPVLKVSPRPPGPQVLDSRQNPELTRVLAPDRPMLAKVIRIVAQQAEIQLADNILNLPRQVGLIRNQLLSLQRNDARQKIEITQLDRKAIYKAILKQLIPQQAETSTSSLIRLINLIAQSAVRPQPVTAQRPETGRSQRLTNPIPAADAGGKPGNRISAGPALHLTQAIRGSLDPQTAVASASTLSGKTATPGSPSQPGTTVRPSPVIESPSPLPSARQVAPGVNNGAPVTTSRSALPGGGKSRESITTGSPVFTPPLSPGRKSENLMQASASAATPRNAGVEYTANQPGSTRAIPRNEPYPGMPASVQAAQTSSGLAIAPGPTQTANLSRQPLAGNTSPAPALQPLLQLVTRFPDIDATQIKKWLEFARLIYPSKAAVSTGATPDIFRLLKQFGEGESFSRELSQALPQHSRVSADTDAPTTRAQVQEALLLQAREGVKLIEQSLSQNLLQRATLGLQQETQQPLSLGFALPYSDDQQTKPLYIDLAQRNQAQDEGEKSWDIRLNFELADLGPIACHLVLAGRAIAASFYSEWAQSRERIEAELPQLRQQLVRAGFTPGEFHSFPGKPAPNRAPTAADFSETLVDIEV